jgi:quinol monooxygenase YgiN
MKQDISIVRTISQLRRSAVHVLGVLARYILLVPAGTRRRFVMTIKVIVELEAKPGRRAELKRLMEAIVAEQGSSQIGFLGSTRYEVLDSPDLLIEIAEWESADARIAHMQESADTGVYEPVIAMLAAPIKATVIRELP